MTRCPHCMSPMESGICAHCGYPSCPRREVNSPLRSGIALSDGRYTLGDAIEQSAQAILYFAWDETLSRAVTILEFFPENLLRRETDGSVLCDGDRERFENCRDVFLKDKTQRVLALADSFEEHGTAYRVYALPQGAQPMALCERLLDHPVHMRDQSGNIFCTVNGLDIPPLPAVRPYVRRMRKKGGIFAFFKKN